jgi:hypothetical protein
MSDTARHGALQHDNDGLRHTLSLDEVGAQLVAAGVPRSRRHIIRLCKSGLFEAKKLPGGSGDEWFVAPDSVPKAIGDLIAIQDRRDRHGPTEPAMADHDAFEKPRNSGTDMARHGAPQRATAGSEIEDRSAEAPTSRYVALLEEDNQFLRDQVKKKDEQITDLSKRFGETQALLGATQRMLAPLLGQADPFAGVQKREVTPPQSPGSTDDTPSDA